MKKDYYDLPYPMFGLSEQETRMLEVVYKVTQEAESVPFVCINLMFEFGQSESKELVSKIETAILGYPTINSYLAKQINCQELRYCESAINILIRKIWIKKLIAHQGYTCHDFPILSDV